MMRLRFAPSPTGYLHIGAARTAFFNWLYARKNKGKFVLRIEDTDWERSSEEMSREIMEALEWLGMDWDEGPFYQSERKELYRKTADDLINRRAAYYCFCSPGEEKREGNWDLKCSCSSLPGEKVQKLIGENKSRAVRFSVPEGEIRYEDLIHGQITVSGDTIEDFVLVRRDGTPTYHLSVVADDIDMEITHVIRGDDHISNTPKQILLYQALGYHLPKFGHLALILGPDKKKLSKRHGVTSVLAFREEGYLPLAVVNYLARMSWSLGEDKALFSIEEMARRFSLKKLSKGSPVFDMEKLGWLNGKLISSMDAEALFPFVRERLKKDGQWKNDLEGKSRQWLCRLIDLYKQRNRTVADFSRRMRPFLSEEWDYDPEGLEKHLSDPALTEIFDSLNSDFRNMDSFDAQNIEIVVRNRAESEGVKAGLLIHALRMLVLGMTVSPGIFEVLELIGKDKTLDRISRLGGLVRPPAE